MKKRQTMYAQRHYCFNQNVCDDQERCLEFRACTDLSNARKGVKSCCQVKGVNVFSECKCHENWKLCSFMVWVELDKLDNRPIR